MHDAFTNLTTLAAEQPAGDQLLAIGLIVLALAGIALTWWQLSRSR